MIRFLGCAVAFIASAVAADLALAGTMKLMGTGDFTAGGGAVSCLVLESDGTSKILLEDGSGCIALEA